MAQPQPTTERELPMLAGIGAFVTWCEDLLAILSGPILTFGLGIALVALLTDGQLLVSVPALLWVWAVSQAVGLDAQFIGAAAKLAKAFRRRHVWPIIGYIILCAALGYVGFLASNVFATQEANGITTAQALGRLGMDSTSWIFQRSVLAVVLVFLSGFLRYVAPAKDEALSADEERAHLKRELELEPLRAELRQKQARGARGVVAAVLGREKTTSPDPLPMTQETPSDALPDDDRTPPPPKGSRPTSYHQSDAASGQAATALAATSYDVRPSSNGRRPRGRARSVAARRGRVRIVGEGIDARRERQRRQADAILSKDPTTNPTALAKRIHSTWKTANRLKNDWLARHTQQREAAAAAK